MAGTLNTKYSIVDYLKSQGQDSSMTARKKLAQELGIANYSGTGSQNKQMLNMLKEKNSGKTNTSNVANSSNVGNSSNAGNSSNETPVTTNNSSFTPSDDVTNMRNEANSYKDKMTEMANIEDILGKDFWDAINTPFSASSVYQDAWAVTQQQLAQLSTGRTSFTDQIKDMMNKIQNREDFQYDVSTDTMFQQSLASAMASGQTAMQDTIGQASALTGGYASTYATSAGNQAYNAYIQDAYNNLPEYYNLAMEAYQMEGKEMYDQLAMLSDADANEYKRMYDSWYANHTNTQQIYQNEYTSWQDTITNLFKEGSLKLEEHGQLYDQLYNTYTALTDNANALYDQEYLAWADGVKDDQFIALNDLNGDGKVDKDDIELQRKWDNEDAYIRNYDTNGDNKVDDKDKTEVTLKEPSETQMQKALEAYNSGGEQGLERYVASLGSSIDVDMLIDYAIQYGKAPITDKIQDGIDWIADGLQGLFTGGTKEPATLPTWEEHEAQRKKNNLYKGWLSK